MRDGSVRYGRCKRRVTRENKSWFFVVLIIDFLPRNSRSQNGNSNSYDFGFRCARCTLRLQHRRKNVGLSCNWRRESRRKTAKCWRQRENKGRDFKWIGSASEALVGVFVYLPEPQRLERPASMPEIHALQNRPLTVSMLHTISCWGKSIPTQRAALFSMLGLAKNFLYKNIPLSKIFRQMNKGGDTRLHEHWSLSPLFFLFVLFYNDMYLHIRHICITIILVSLFV